MTENNGTSCIASNKPFACAPGYVLANGVTCVIPKCAAGLTLNTSVTPNSKCLCPEGSVCTPSFTNLSIPITYNGLPFTGWGSAQWTFMADINGDGLPDIVTVNPTAATPVMYVLYNNQSGATPVFDVVQYPLSAGWGTDDRLSTMDFKALGRASIVTINRALNSAYVYYLSDTNYKKVGTKPAATMVGENWGINPLAGKYQGNPNFYYFGNFDGKGPGIATIAGGNAYMSLATGMRDHFISATWTLTPNYNGNSNFMWSGDFTGNGIWGIASAASSNFYVNVNTQLSTGGTSMTQNACPFRFGWTSNNNWIGDFAGHLNGQLDFVEANGNTLGIAINDGNRCFKAQSLTIQTPNNQGVQWGGNCGGTYYNLQGDFNGDGLNDILTTYANTYSVILNQPSTTLESVSMVIPTGLARLTNPSGFAQIPCGYGTYLQAGGAFNGLDNHQGRLFSVDFFNNGLSDVVSIQYGGSPVKSQVNIMQSSVKVQ